MKLRDLIKRCSIDVAVLSIFVFISTAYAATLVLSDGKDVYINGGFLSVASGLKTQGNFERQGSNGEGMVIKVATEALENISGATETTSSLIASDALVYGCVTRVTEAVTGSTTFTIGDGTDADKWGTGIAQTLGTTTDEDDWTGTSHPEFYTSLDVTLTGTGGSFTDGGVRVSCFYTEFDAPAQ